MKKRAVLSATGRDRVGVVDDLGAALSERNIWIRDSRMTSLGGRFSAIVEICGEPSDVERLRRDLAGLGRGFDFELHLDEVGAGTPTARRPRLVIESYTAKPAALNEVTRLLKGRNVNIDEVSTETSAGAWECQVSFHMVVRATVPATVSVDELRRELRELERRRDLDIVVRTSEADSTSPVIG
jgi:glycine cleavage system transcriptional repressor